MSTTHSGLKQLHELHIELREVEGALELGPRQIAARKLAFEKKQAELEARRQKLKQCKMVADQKIGRCSGTRLRDEGLRLEWRKGDSPLKIVRAIPATRVPSSWVDHYTVK